MLLLLGGFLAVSGAVWLGGLATLGALDGGAQTLPVTLAVSPQPATHTC